MVHPVDATALRLRPVRDGHHLAMTSSDGPTPYDGDGRVEIRGCPGWSYMPFSVPTYVSRGDELGEITRLVIRARVRMERSAGLGS
jgi:hypothetical protein